MFERKSLKLPITLGVSMIVVTVALLVGWILLTVFAATRSSDGSIYWFLLSIGTISFAGVLVGSVIYLTLSVKAVNLTRRQSNFIDSVTHELKSPIASLKLYLQTLDKREVSEEERRKFIDIMMSDVERLDTLINHVLDAGYSTRNNPTESAEVLQLSSIIQQCAHLVASRYHVDKEIIQLDLEPCEIQAERIDTVMIFRNLIDNAVKYAGDPPLVQVNLSVNNNIATVRIADNGPGIPADERSKVFGRFVRLGSELQREKPGTGLGLHIVRTLLKRSQGKIRILDNSSEDLGTVFEVKLPGARRTTSIGKTKPNKPVTQPAV